MAQPGSCSLAVAPRRPRAAGRTWGQMRQRGGRWRTRRPARPPRASGAGVRFGPLPARLGSWPAPRAPFPGKNESLVPAPDSGALVLHLSCGYESVPEPIPNRR